MSPRTFLRATALTAAALVSLIAAPAALAAPPANDNFAGAQVIAPATLPVNLPATNLDATFEAGEPAVFGGAAHSQSVWFRWTAPAPGPVRIDVCDFHAVNGSGNTSVGVYTGTTLGTLTKIAEGDNFCQAEFMAVQGTEYKIGFSAVFGGEGNFTLRLLSAIPASNDTFSSTTILGSALPVGAIADNTFATMQAGEPSHGGLPSTRHSLWFSWTPATSQTVRISACSPDFGARLGVYTGNAVNALTPQGIEPPFGPFCRETLFAMGGQTYRIAVAGGPFLHDEGLFTLDIHGSSPPANDDLENAQPIGPGFPVAIGASTTDATVQTGEPSTAQDAGAYATVWYRVTPSRTTTLALDTCGSSFNAVFGVFTGSQTDIDSLVRVGGVGEETHRCTGAPGYTETVGVTAGQTYLISLGGDPDREGAFALHLSDPSAPPAATIVSNGKKKRAKCRHKHGKKRRKCLRRARHNARN
jgi:hypothetical protein